MTEWFDGLSALQQALFVVALFSTSVFAIQVIFSLLGIGEVDETEAGELPNLDDGSIGDDVGGDSAFGNIFTIRNGISFLMGLSWGGLMAYDWGLTHIVFVVLVGLVVGAFFTGINMGLLALLAMVKHEGNVRIENTVGQTGTVTLAVPEGRNGVGKVSVSVQGRLMEYHAITDGDALRRNSAVTVLGFAGSQLVVGHPTTAGDTQLVAGGPDTTPRPA